MNGVGGPKRKLSVAAVALGATALFFQAAAAAVPPPALLGDLHQAKAVRLELSTLVCVEALPSYVIAVSGYAIAEGACGNPELHAALKVDASGRWVRLRCGWGGGVAPDSLLYSRLVSRCGVPASIANRIVAHHAVAVTIQDDDALHPLLSDRCVSTTVTKAEYYFPGQPQSGHFLKLARGPLDPFIRHAEVTEIVDRSAISWNGEVSVGDHVQACLVQVQPRDFNCNPNQDYRGRVIRLWDYDRNILAGGRNANHGCGGA